MTKKDKEVLNKMPTENNGAISDEDIVEKNKATVRQERYDKDNTFRIAIKFNKKTDADIKSWIDTIKDLEIGSVQGYIKRLIRADIAKHQKSGISIKEYFVKSWAEFEKNKE